MTDYVYREGNAGMMRFATGARQNNWPWIGHPRDRLTNYPVQPRFALADAAWSEDLATFQALCTAEKWSEAIGFVRDGGFAITTADVPGGALATFVGWLQANGSLTVRECLRGSGW